MAVSHLTPVPADQPALRGQISEIVHRLAGIEAVLGLTADYLADVDDGGIAHRSVMLTIDQVDAARTALERIRGY
jgi:hypothetical protein